jgi:hypothetical protein
VDQIESACFESVGDRLIFWFKSKSNWTIFGAECDSTFFGDISGSNEFSKLLDECAVGDLERNITNYCH